MLEKLNRNAVISEGKSWKIIEVPDSNLAFTFYRTIFLGDRLSEVEKQQVLSHELVHVRQKHTLDLLFFELQKIIFWFNPLIYIFQAKITDLHEFIADARAVKTIERKEYYQQLLNSAFGTQNISFINQFNHSFTRLTAFGKTFTFGKFDGQVKKRIVMLQKSKSKTISKLKFLVIIPLMLVMLFYVSCSEEKKMAKIPQTTLSPSPSISKDLEKTYQQEVNDVPFAIVEEIPIYPGCENLETDKEKKACISDKITRFVNSNFDTSLGKKLGLTGLNRVDVQFRINRNGVVEVLRVRAPHEALEEEARRVVNGLPKMVKPAKHNGENVGVLYFLPINFRVSE